MQSLEIMQTSGGAFSINISKYQQGQLQAGAHDLWTPAPSYSVVNVSKGHK